MQQQLSKSDIICLLRKGESERTEWEVFVLFNYVRELECFSSLTDGALQMLCHLIRYEFHSAGSTLYKIGDTAECWYILISGNVLINDVLFVTPSSFGKRINGCVLRQSECLILDDSELMVIDYRSSAVQIMKKKSTNATLVTSKDVDESEETEGGEDQQPKETKNSETEAKETSRDGQLIDSDVEDSLNDSSNLVSSGSLVVKDTVKDCLEKLPKDRTEDDIEVILNFMQHFPAFSNMTLSTRRGMCAVVAFALIDQPNTTIYCDGQELDSWSIIINGQVEVIQPDGNTIQLQMGDSFGLQTTKDKRFHIGEMFTRSNNCQFVCIAQEDFYKILHEGVENTEKSEEGGKVVWVTEKRMTRNSKKTGHVVIRGSVEKLINNLVDDQSLSADPTYTEDFLLTFRSFLKSPFDLASQLMIWLNSQNHSIRDKAVRVFLLWVNNHFIDFEFETGMNDFLLKFENILMSQAMKGQLKLFAIACSVKARQRSFFVSRLNFSEDWSFSVVEGNEKIFIHSVKKGSSTGLLQADQILELNGRLVESISIEQLSNLFCTSLNLEIRVRFNICDYRQMCLASVDDDKVKQEIDGEINFTLKKSSKVIPLRKMKVLHKPTNSANERSSYRYLSSSHPDLSSSAGRIDDVIQIYKTDETFKSLMINREMTVAEVVDMAVKEFAILDSSSSSSYSLHEMIGFDDQCKSQMIPIPYHLKNLIDRVAMFNSKIYLLNATPMTTTNVDNNCSSSFEMNPKSLLQLTPEEIAKQLTSRDLQIFKDIESVEYVVDIFGLDSKYGTPNLTKFSKLVNEEMFWVMTEVCSENTAENRAKCIQKFIKIAKCCKELNNFNSMFSIISGLCHGSVSRLKLTWEKLPAKYEKLFRSMEDLLDPSRNMSNYRNLLNSQLVNSIAIPIFPIVKKDLTFIHLGNDSKVEGLVNFEKLRMISKEVRRLTNMASSSYNNNIELLVGSSSSFLSLTSSSIPSSYSAGNASVFATLRKKKPLPQMSERVKIYFSNLSVIEDEKRLIEMSNQLEPPGGKRKHLSSLLPFTESASCVPETKQTSGPKFGTNSTQAVEKIMSLTDKIKPHDQKKHPLPTNVQPILLPALDPRLSKPSQQPQPMRSRHVIPMHLSDESSSVVGPRAHSATRSLDSTNSYVRFTEGSRNLAFESDIDIQTSLTSSGSCMSSHLSNQSQEITVDFNSRMRDLATASIENLRISAHSIGHSSSSVLLSSDKNLPMSSPVSPSHPSNSHRLLPVKRTDVYHTRGFSDDTSAYSPSSSSNYYKNKSTKTRMSGVNDLSDEELLVSFV